MLFAWAIAAVSWHEDLAEELLGMIARQCVTMRGHSHAKSLMELYKKKAQSKVFKNRRVFERISRIKKMFIINNDIIVILLMY